MIFSNRARFIHKPVLTMRPERATASALERVVILGRCNSGNAARPVPVASSRSVELAGAHQAIEFLRVDSDAAPKPNDTAIGNQPGANPGINRVRAEAVSNGEF